MKISILTENSACDIWFLAEWWLSFWLEVNDKKILFDTWYSTVFMKNAEKLNINLNELDYIVISHHHNDHIDWLFNLRLQEKKKIIFHSDILNKLDYERIWYINENFELNITIKPFFITEEIVFLWEIPRINDFELWINTDDNDKMLDDSAIAINTPKWVIVISWCSHSWICNICDYSKKIFNKNIYAVIWWFHLFWEENEIVNKTIDYFQNENIEYLYPLHCVDFQSLNKFYNSFKIKKLLSWEILEIN